jgi:hypothetical protein
MLVVSLLAIYPHTPARMCMERRQVEIGQQATDAAAATGVPIELLAAVGFHESHVGCDEADWGAPVDRFHRHIAGTPLHAARALARSYEVCGDWRGAVTRFRSGLCSLPAGDVRKHYVASVMRLADRLRATASRE